MPFNQKLLASFLNRIESWFDRLKYNKPPHSPLWIQPYRGFGTSDKVYIKGRVLEGKPIRPASVRDNMLTNLVRSFQRFDSDEVPLARLNLSCSGAQKIVQADEEGYFEGWLTFPKPLPADQRCQLVRLELIEPQRSGFLPVIENGEACLTPPDAPLGIISDIDDTVILSHVQRRWRMIYTVLFKNAFTRRSFPGTAAFYRGLVNGSNSEQHNPVFYVSTSPWNIYDMLLAFLSIQRFPPEPVLYLRDWGISNEEVLPLDNLKHKLTFIEILMQVYPGMNFILIGDSGQQDPEIYVDVVERFPGRVQAVYIREVTHDDQRIESIHHLRSRCGKSGVTMLLSENVLAFTEHAAIQGWLPPKTLAQVRSQIHKFYSIRP
jgi:phosphatidate phosphatase APP1